MKIALGQIAVTGDKDANLVKIAAQVKRAAEAGARLAVFPEASMFHFGKPTEALGPAAETVDGHFRTTLSELARRFEISIVAGMFEKVDGDPKRVYNTLLALDERGGLYGTYRKIHLYDALGFVESDRIVAGDGETLTFVCDGVRFGALTCYDLRFPEVARHLVEQHAEALLLPAAWLNGPLKEMHFETLIRARAIENTVYVFAADQVGSVYSGNSCAIDPMGVTLAAAGETEALLVAELSPARLADVRAKLPSVANRRPEIYQRWRVGAPVGV